MRCRIQRARLWWSLFVQPGDSVAGLLIGELGPRRAAGVLNGTEDPRVSIRREKISEISPDELARLRHRYPRRPNREQVDTVYRILRRLTISLIEPGDPRWPDTLDHLGPHAPLLLFARGDTSLMAQTERLVAVVGTRKPSIEGARAARTIASGLASAGVVSVSGGALGVDAIAHRFALQQLVPTVLVAATPLDRAYPREHRGLFDAVASRGLLLSETPPTATISPSSFLARNRIIAALSQHTIVVECPAQSGALNTASHAAQLGRELWAVHYPVEHDTNRGYRRLVEEWGARPLQLTGDTLAVPEEVDFFHVTKRAV